MKEPNDNDNNNDHEQSPFTSSTSSNTNNHQNTNEQQQQQHNSTSLDENINNNNNENNNNNTTKHSIAMVCDFFYPKLGGVENHIYSLSYNLIQLGHKVIIITSGGYTTSDSSTGSTTDTNKQQQRKRRRRRLGVRYLPGPIKVYYVPFIVMNDNLHVTIPLFICSYPLIRNILLREQTSIVHCHQATSVLANECISLCSIMNNYIVDICTSSVTPDSDSGTTNESTQNQNQQKHQQNRRIIRSVYTDHSLFSINSDIASVILNRVLQVTLSTCNAVICVSNACCTNFLLRTQRLNSSNTTTGRNTKTIPIRDDCIIRVIPNAVSAEQFVPPSIQQLQQTIINNCITIPIPTTTTTNNTAVPVTQSSSIVQDSINNKKLQIIPQIVIVIISRLVYRKGVDLLVRIIPIICKKFPHIDSNLTLNNNKSDLLVNIDFIIGGDGSKLLELQEMIEYEQLLDRVTFLGSVQHSLVPSILQCGHIFLNCSLTESFCIAILEASLTGMKVVSTNVGGIPEVLPTEESTIVDKQLYLSNPNLPDLVTELCNAIQDCYYELISVLEDVDHENKVVNNSVNDTAEIDGNHQQYHQQNKQNQQRQQEEEIQIFLHNSQQQEQQQQQLLKLQQYYNKLLQRHITIRNLYSWERVAIDTIHVYDTISNHVTTKNSTYYTRLQCYYHSANGGFYGFVVAYIISNILELFYYILHYYIQPISSIDIVPNLQIPIINNKKNSNNNKITNIDETTTIKKSDDAFGFYN